MREEGKKVQKAVALQYDAQKDSSPRVVAKGTGQTAENIIKQAEEHDVAVQEDRSLVEVLSKLELGEQIPAELYQVVAEILSFVYRSDRALGDSLRREDK
jgi:flagellar biosynthesis protein